MDKLELEACDMKGLLIKQVWPRAPPSYPCDRNHESRITMTECLGACCGTMVAVTLPQHLAWLCLQSK